MGFVRTTIAALIVFWVLGVGGASRLHAFQAPPPAAGSLDAGQLQQLAAPIALDPDPLVAQILAASTYPSQIVEADRWVQANSGLSASQFANEVNQQAWDPSIMALTEYPSVLANLDQNLAWTSALGDAYYNQPDDVMAAIQTLRQRALAAGTLRSTSQLTVVQSDGTIAIEPGNPDIVYVPSYDAWVNYGSPLSPWPGYILPIGVAARPGLFFGIGFNVGIFSNYGWGWRGWRSDWSGRRIIYNNQPYVSRSPTFFNRGGRAGVPPGALHGGARYSPPPAPIRSGRGATPPRPAAPGRPGRAVAPSRPAPTPRAVQPVRPPTATPRPQAAARPAPVAPNPRAVRGFTPQPRSAAGTSSSAFSGFNHAAVAASNSARGQSSLRAAPASKPPAAAKGRGGRE